MPVVGIRELAKNVSQLISDVESSQEPAVITRHGRPVAMILAVDAAFVEDFVLAHAREYAESIRDADEALAAGRTRPLSSVLDDLDDAEATTAEEAASAADTNESAAELETR